MICAWIQVPLITCQSQPIPQRGCVSRNIDKTKLSNPSIPKSNKSNLPPSPNPSISVLPSDVIQHIAAGEVLPDLKAVVQELVENSLDAHATNITIHVDLVQSTVTVRDNGTGISSNNDLYMVATCNATSKLNNLTQLKSGIKTLGFRGQALWALAIKSSTLTVSSCVAEQNVGYRVSFLNGLTVPYQPPKPVAMNIGTIVSATGLKFHHQHSNIANLKLQFAQCKTWLMKTSLSYPDINFRLKDDTSKIVWQTLPNNSNNWLIRSLSRYVKASPSDFRSVSIDIPSIATIKLTLALPSLVTSTSKSWLVVTVNGRCVHLHTLAREIRTVCNLKKGRYPIALVSLDVDAKYVDWNVSPRKTEVRFREYEVENQIQHNLRNLVHKCLRVVSVQESNFADSSQTDSSREQTHTNDFAQESKLRRLLCNPVATTKLRVVGQALCTYIIVEYGLMIMLIEQHVAEERVLFEALIEDFSQDNFVSLEQPIKFSSSVPDQWIFTLTTLGFQPIPSAIDQVGNESEYIIDSVPVCMKDVTTKQIQAILERVCRTGASLKEAAASISCQLALKNGTTLEHSKMNKMVKSLLSCDNPWTCPHGRPIIVTVDNKQLAGLFSRSWTPEQNLSGKNSLQTILQDDFQRTTRGILPE